MVTRLRLCLISMICIFISGGLHIFAQNDSSVFRIRYKVNIPEIENAYLDNDSRILELREFLEELSADTNAKVNSIYFKGTASPEGTYEFNQWLSKKRLENFRNLVAEYISLPDSSIIKSESSITWDEFHQKVAESEYPWKEEVLEIIDLPERIVPYYGNRHIDSRLLKLRQLDNGRVYYELKEPILRDLRYGLAIFDVSYPKPELIPQTDALSLQTIQTISFPDIIFRETDRFYLWTPKFHLKTNLAAWALAISNIAAEIDLGHYWSFTVPIYYSAWDYFKSTIKFRTLAIQPELRYWPRKTGNEGFFIGPHFGMAYFNVAVDGPNRYQDYRGKTPALGGGVSIGYRISWGQKRNWHLEVTAGAGVYPLDYSIFYNTPDVKDGQWHDRRKKTYFGLDNFGITLGYSFDINKYARQYKVKGGKAL